MTYVELLAMVLGYGRPGMSKGMNEMVQMIAEQLQMSATHPSQSKALGLKDGWEKTISSHVTISRFLTAQHPKTMEELANR